MNWLERVRSEAEYHEVFGQTLKTLCRWADNLQGIPLSDPERELLHKETLRLAERARGAQG